MNVPGYTGYIPGKLSEHDVYGKTFAAANDHASATVGCRTPRGLKPEAAGRPWKRDSYLLPGYGGHLPGKDEGAFGVTYRVAAQQAREAKTNPAQMVRPGAFAGGGPTERGGRIVCAIPGYKGHVPGKKSENIIGGTYAASNTMAIQDFADYAKATERNAWRRIEAPGFEHRRNSGAAKGLTVPGYTGHVPGKKAEGDRCGMTFSQANQHANFAHKMERAAKLGVPYDAMSPMETGRSYNKETPASANFSAGNGKMSPAPSEASSVSKGSRSSAGNRSHQFVPLARR